MLLLNQLFFSRAPVAQSFCTISRSERFTGKNSFSHVIDKEESLGSILPLGVNDSYAIILKAFHKSTPGRPPARQRPFDRRKYMFTARFSKCLIPFESLFQPLQCRFHFKETCLQRYPDPVSIFIDSMIL